METLHIRLYCYECTHWYAEPSGPTSLSSVSTPHYPSYRDEPVGNSTLVQLHYLSATDEAISVTAIPTHRNDRRLCWHVSSVGTIEDYVGTNNEHTIMRRSYYYLLDENSNSF